MRDHVAAAFVALVCAVAGGCSSPPSEARPCPNDMPAGCPPAGAPSYATEVQPIVAQRCAVCHTSGGAAASWDLTTYDELYGRRREALSRIFGCRMPPPDATALSAAERKSLLAWFVCGAPNTMR